MQFHSSPCSFLGYSLRHKGFKCLSSNGRMFISRHVIFDETQFLVNTKPTVIPLHLASTSVCPRPIPLCRPILSSSTSPSSTSNDRDSPLSSIGHSSLSPLISSSSQALSITPCLCLHPMPMFTP